jgi:hypothetical protein
LRPKDPIINVNFDTYAKNVEAILINPNWNLNPQSEKKGGKSKGITFQEFS